VVGGRKISLYNSMSNNSKKNKLNIPQGWNMKKNNDGDIYFETGTGDKKIKQWNYPMDENKTNSRKIHGWNTNVNTTDVRSYIKNGEISYNRPKKNGTARKLHKWNPVSGKLEERGPASPPASTSASSPAPPAPPATTNKKYTGKFLIKSSDINHSVQYYPYEDQTNGDFPQEGSVRYTKIPVPSMDGWDMYMSPKHNNAIYFVNETTGTSQWDLPVSDDTPKPSILGPGPETKSSILGPGPTTPPFSGGYRRPSKTNRRRKHRRSIKKTRKNNRRR